MDESKRLIDELSGYANYFDEKSDELRNKYMESTEQEDPVELAIKQLESIIEICDDPWADIDYIKQILHFQIDQLKKY